MNFKFSYILSFKPFLLAITCTLLCACNNSILPEEMKAETQKQQETTVVPDVDAICRNLKKEMSAMTSQRTTFALEEINRDIRLCLPIINAQEQKNLMSLADQMYANFLSVDRTPEQQRAFDQFAFDQSPFPTIHQSHIEQLHPRDQYLLRHKGQAYIELKDLGNGKTRYSRNALYLAKVFAPSFPEAEKTFMVELGNQNQTQTFSKNSVLITPQEIVKRALFWESYLQKYPHSRFKQDAEYLFNVYQYFFFIGLPDTPVSTHFEGTIDIQPATLTEIELLVVDQKTHLSKQAQKFLKFIQLNHEQRVQLMPNELKNASTAIQVSHYLNLKPVDLNQLNSRDCFSDAICR